MKLFTQWFILNAVTATGLFLAQTNGLVSLIINNDSSYLALTISILYCIVTAIMGKIALDIDNNRVVNSEKQMKLVKLICDNFTMLGLLSTLIGFAIMLQKTTSLEEQLRQGMGTAFYPSLAGIIATILAQIQKFIIKK